MTDSLSISDLAKVICPPGSSRRVMALLSAYCDASFTGHNRSPGWTAVAGYLGTDEMWSRVQEQWAENKKLWQIEEFSLAKIMAGEAPGIGNTNAELCVGSFGRIIRESGLEGVSAAINDADWAQVYKNERFPTKYHLCLSMLFHIIDEHMRLEFKGDHVAIVLDTDTAHDDALRGLIDEWKIEAPRIASIAFGRRSQYPVLECADLCAGTERHVQIAGGRDHVLRDNKWFSIAHAHRHKSVFWSLADQQRVEARLKEREERRRRQREGEG